ncbi:MAG TPA: hypothetical protein VN962_27625 [Polyangia bacterium]|nr:hypothetical protein [Polyangia bacterium]
MELAASPGEGLAAAVALAEGSPAQRGARPERGARVVAPQQPAVVALPERRRREARRD